MMVTEMGEMGVAYRSSANEIVTMLGSDAQQGLTTDEAQARLQRHGKNELSARPPVPAWRRFLGQFVSPLTILLLIATVISFITWIIEADSPIPYESLTILAIVLLNGILGYIQENRAERAVATLQAMSVATARVLRDGQLQVIPTSDVVPGDILLIEEGDTLPADARVLQAISLSVAEAALTGESTPVSKHDSRIDKEISIGDQENMVFGSTSVTSGRGKAIVTTTGAYTEIGKIADSLQQIEVKKTPLQKELDQIGKLLGIIVILIALVISVTILLVNQVRTLTDIVDILLLAVSLAVAAVPEGLSAVTNIVLSLGMQHMARRNVIVRKLSAVEALGSTTVICTDKTGTLTRNEMTVQTVVTASGRVDVTGIGYDPQGTVYHNGQPLTNASLLEELEMTLRVASLVNNAALLYRDGKWTIQGDPTEGALLVAARKIGFKTEEIERRFPRIAEIPFSSERKRMSTAHKDAEQDEPLFVFSKGAPDVLLARCTHEQKDGEILPMAEKRREEILRNVELLAAEALRTIGVVFRTLQHETVMEDLDDRIEQEFVWLGVIGMIDPPRPEAKDAVRRAQQAGIRVIMITGDHPITSTVIARELGIMKKDDRILTGAELEKLDEEQFRELVRVVSVYARVAPEHKLRIVRALQANNEVVAMTGDGVNDAPALKKAHIGIAMGITGTDVSREAADMILTDDNFASIVAAVEEGRCIFANIQKFLRYLLLSNVGEVLTMFFGVILAGVIGLVGEAGTSIVIPLLSTQILWINLLTDSAPALALGVDQCDPGLMRQRPRDPRSGVITKRIWLDIVFGGVIMFIGTLLVMDWALPGGLISGNGTLRYAQTMAFTTLVLLQLFNMFNARSDEKSAFSNLLTNPWIWVALLISLLLQALVLYVPFLQRAFSTVALSVTDWLVCCVVGSTVLWLYELVKLVRRQWGR